MRVKIQFPEHKLFSTDLRIRITDVNYGNHTGNDAMVGLLHEARLQWLVSEGFSELDAGGTSLIMADLAIAYKHETFYGDEITIELYVDTVTSKSFNLYYKVFKKSQPELIIATAKTGMACFDYNERKIVLMSDALREKLEVTS